MIGPAHACEAKAGFDIAQALALRDRGVMRGAVLVLVISIAGCDEPYDVDKYWAEIASAHCTAMESCCTSAEYTDWWTQDDGDRLDCFKAHSSPTYAYFIRRGIDKGTIVFSTDKARSCVIALENLPCEQFEPAIRFRESYCESPFTGVMPTGAAPCQTDQECQSGHCNSVGTCVAGIPPGDPCAGAAGICDGPYRCQSNGICALGLPPGASCESDAACADDWCKNDSILTSGTCRQACDGI